MRKIIVESNTPGYANLIPKIFRIYTYPIIEIAAIFHSHTIIEYHIFCPVFRIVGANLGKKESKFIVTKLLQINSMGTAPDVFEWSLSRFVL